MIIQLNNLEKTTQKRKQRVGRGVGSNRGKNCGLGNKGQSKRGHVRIGFEGGQKSLIRRTPKFRGFKQYDRKDTVSFPLDSLIKQLNGSEITLKSLIEAGIVHKFIKHVRILKPNATLESQIEITDDNIYLTKGAKQYIKNI